MHRRMTRRLSLLAALVAVVAVAGAVAWSLAALPRRTRELAIAAASAAFGRDVQIGRVHGNPWRGLVFEDVQIGGPTTPVGAGPSLSARRVTLFFDPLVLVQDAWRGRGIGGSLSQVQLEEPVLAVGRDSTGRWNLGDLLPGVSRPGREAPFLGRVVVLNGTLMIADHYRLAPRIFEARFEDTHGTLDFSRAPRVALRASFVESRGGRRVPGRLSGAYDLSTQGLDIELEATGADAGSWGPYIVTTPAVRITGGEFDARVHLLRTHAGRRLITDYQGRITLRDGRAIIPDRGAVIARAEGEIAVSNQMLSTTRLSGTVNGSPVEVRGEVSFHGDPRLDLAVRTPRVDLATVRRLFFPKTRLQVAGVAAGDVRIVGPYQEPRLVGRIASATGQIEQQAFDRASGEFAYYGSLLRVANARAHAGGGQVSGSGWWTTGAPDFLLDVHLDGTDATWLSRWSPTRLPAADGRVTGDLLALRRGTDLRIAAHAWMDRPRISGLRLDALEATFRTDPAGVHLEQLAARQGPSWAVAHGRVRPEGTLALSASGGGIDLAALPGLPIRGVAAGRADFTGHVSGTLAAPELAGHVRVEEGQVAGLAFDTAGGTVALRRGALRLDHVAARRGRAQYRATGSVTWDDVPRLMLDVEADRASAPSLGRLARLPFEVTGQVDARVRLEGPASRLSAHGTVSLREAQVYGQTVDVASGAFRWDGTRLTVEGGSVRRNDSLIQVAGIIDRRTGFGLDIAARGLNLEDAALPPVGATRVEGRVDVTGRVTGRPSAPVLTLAASSTDLTINGIRFDDASGQVRWEGHTLRLDPLRLGLRDERYQIEGDIVFGREPALSLTATVTSGRLSTLLGMANVRLGLPLDGTVSGLATMEGPVANPTARLDLRLAGGRFADHTLIDGHADLTLRDGGVTIKEFQVRPERGLIAVQGRLNLRGESQIEVDGRDLALDLLRPFFRLRRPLLGRLNFTMQLGGTLASPEIGFSQEITRGGIEGATFDSLVANVFYRDGLLQVQQALLVQNGHKLRASGSVPFNPALLRFDDRRPMEFRLRLADVNLGLLRLFTDRVMDAVGAVEGEVLVSGTVAAPHVTGGMQVRDGRVRLRGLETPLEAIRLSLQFDDNVVRVAEGTVRLGTGIARLDGAARIVQLPSAGAALVVSEDAPLVLQGSNLRVVVPPFVDARAEGVLRLWGTLGDPRRPPTVGGRVTVSDGTITVASVGDGEPLRAPLAFHGVRFDVGRNLAVQVGGMRLDLKPEASVVLTGTLSAPMLEGTVSAQQGKVLAFGTVFDLLEGTAMFRPHQGIIPAVSVQGETQVGTTHVTLALRGTPPDGLRRELRSDPELSEPEILRLLGRYAGFGRLIEGDISGAVRTEISRRLFGRVTASVGRAFALTELTVEYDFEGPLSLRAGKLLLRDLYLTVETTFAAQTRWLWGLEYRLARGWQFTLRVGSDGNREAVVWYTTRF
ncbi:MAG: translocation/assembly module TamB domain-containing protein [Armatimonadetes bacterium]|nr:translocation/assembly module TamB domain-containing protein [Armatimonadota bacterium]